MGNYLSFSCVHVMAIDASMTDTTYSECVNRNGVRDVDIGKAVINAVKSLKDPDSLSELIVRLSHDT